MYDRSETVDATVARARLGDLLARSRCGGWRFVIEQRGNPAAMVIGYQEYRALVERLEHLQDVRDMVESEGEPAHPLGEYPAARGQPGAAV